MTDGVIMAGPVPVTEVFDVIEDSIDVDDAPVAGPAAAGHLVPVPPVAVDRAPPGRVLVAIGPLLADDAAAEMLATRLCRSLSGERCAELLDRHAAADDLAHWAAVDAARAALMAPFDVVVCLHELADPGWRGLLVLDVPAEHRDRAVQAVADLPSTDLPSTDLPSTDLPSTDLPSTDLPSTQVIGILDDTGWVGPGTEQPAAAPLVLAAVGRQAARTAGRALVFPGQSVLAEDVTLDVVLARTAVDRLHSVHGDDYRSDAVLRCHGYARPRYVDGALTLSVGHDWPDQLVAVEVRYSRPCCGEDH